MAVGPEAQRRATTTGAARVNQLGDHSLIADRADDARRGARWAGWVSAGCGMAAEAVWLSSHLWCYPWGVVPEHVEVAGSYAHYRTDPLPPAQRGLIVSNMAAAATPVLLVHGLADNRSVFARLRAVLHRRGYGVVHAVNHSILTSVHGDIRGAAAELGAHVQRVRDRTGADRVHMIGHSLGGLIARYYVQRHGGHAVVDGLVTVGSPHRGSRAAALLPPTPLVRQLRPGSELISELAAPATDCASRFLAVWSHLDATMVPRASARLDHPDLEVEHFELAHVGHIAMVNNPRVLHHITGWLARQDTTRPTRRQRPEQRPAS